MGLHPAVKKSFFIRLLLTTALIGNLYLCLQAAFHSCNFHQLDVWVRWYAFVAHPLFNIILLAGTVVTLIGLRNIFQNGMPGFKWYAWGKLITTIAYSILILLEYNISHLPLPFILFPILVVIESIYPILLYLSLRKSKARTSY